MRYRAGEHDTSDGVTQCHVEDTRTGEIVSTHTNIDEARDYAEGLNEKDAEPAFLNTVTAPRELLDGFDPDID